MLIAEKKGIKKPFSEESWKCLPKHKYGWTLISEDKKMSDVPTEIIERHIIPDIPLKKNAVEENKIEIIPNEVIIKKKVGRKKNG